MRILNDEKIEVENYTGMLFQIQGSNPSEELWGECKLAALNELNKNPQGYTTSIIDSSLVFYIVHMPCNSFLEFHSPQSILDLPIEDIPCHCGDKSHWFVRFVSYV